MDKIIILGKGGHAQSIIDAIEEQGKYEIAGYIVNEEKDIVESGDYPIIGKDEDLKKIFQSGIHYAAVGIGFMGKGNVRERLYEQLKEIGYSLPIISDPTAVISKKSVIAEGTFVGKGSVVNANTKVGKMCIINTGAIVEHDVHIGDFTHVSVGTVLCGNVHVGYGAFIGANATVIQGRNVGDRCIVGAGEVVRKNVINKGN